jgi:peptidoglycan/LPS O-acetylase OafA/YrhL
VRRPDPRFDGIDTLRALAALSVFGFHLALQPGFLAPGWLAPYAANLNVGVSVFFVISGFVIYRPFARARLEGERLPSLPRFGVRRAARIVPGYWVALLGIALWLGLDNVLDPAGIATYFGFAQVYRSTTAVGGIGQAWSLCIEVTFYVGVAVLALVLARRRPRSDAAFLRSELAVAGALVLATVLWRLAPFYAVPRFGSSPPASLTLPAYADELAFGMALAVVSVWAAARPRPPRLPFGAWTGWVLAAAAFIGAGLLVDAGTTQSKPGNLVHHLLLGLVGVGLLLPAIAEPHGRLRAVLEHPAARWGGFVSFGFYLWHLAVLRSLTDHGWAGRISRPGYLVVALGASVALAAASWYLVERPSIRLARRLGRRPAPAAQPEGALR